MIRILIALLALGLASPALAQGTNPGILQPGQILGNSGSSPALPAPVVGFGVSSTTVNATLPFVSTGTPASPVAGQGIFGGSATGGAVITGNGSVSDFTLQSSSGVVECNIAHAATFVMCYNQSMAPNGTMPGLQLVATQPASSGNQFYSPSLELSAFGWKTNATAGSIETDWLVFNSPVQGTTAPSTFLNFQGRSGVNAFVNTMQLASNEDAFPSATFGPISPTSLGAAGDIQLGRSASQAFAFFGGNGSQYISFNGGVFNFSTGSGVMSVPNGAGGLASVSLADQTITGGANVTTLALSTGNITVDCGARPTQSITNNGAWTITAPSNDGSCDLLVTNGASAALPTFSGFTVGANTGSPLTTTNGNKFTITIWRISGTSGYTVFAHQ